MLGRLLHVHNLVCAIIAIDVELDEAVFIIRLELETLLLLV